MTDIDNALNPQYFGSDPADIRIGINPEIRIQISGQFQLIFRPWRSLRSLSAFL